MKNKVTIKKLSILLPIIFLLIIGCINTYGASFTNASFSGLYIKQIIWCIISIFTFLLVSKVNIDFIYRYSFLFYILGVVSLIIVLFIGANINGATSWIKLGSLSIQPSELFKPFFLIYLSCYMNKHDNKYYYLKLFLIIFIPVILIFIEPDSGVAAMYMLMSLGVILSYSKNKKLFIIASVCLILILTIFIYMYICKKDILFKILPISFYYRIDRLLRTDNYQIKNALVGMGSSGITGHGLKNIKVYIPEMISDFAFSLLIMNFGYIIGILTVFIYCYLLFTISKFKSLCRDNVSAGILNGTIFVLFFQCVEHIFMNLSLTPITGITLPFLSYGGSSLFSYVILFSLIIKITTNSSSYS